MCVSVLAPAITWGLAGTCVCGMGWHEGCGEIGERAGCPRICGIMIVQCRLLLNV